MSISIKHQTVLDLVDAAGGTLDVRGDYSGRGMYGDRCLGVVGSISAFASFLVTVAKEAAHTDDPALWSLLDELEDPSTDSMGRESIFYWPRITLTDLVQDEDEDTFDWEDEDDEDEDPPDAPGLSGIEYAAQVRDQGQIVR